MNIAQAGNTKGRVQAVVRNASTSVAIKAGSPVFMKYDADNPGVDVVPAEEAGATNNILLLGNSFEELSVGEVGYAGNFGYYEIVRVALGTRAASTDVFPTRPAIALGDTLIPVTGLAGVQAWSRATALPTNGGPWAIACNTYATQASSATTTSNSLLSNEVSTGKIFLRRL